MKTKISAAGTVLTCLMLCAGCTSARPAPTPVIVPNACPKVSLCPMPGSDPQKNGDLSAISGSLRTRWHAVPAR
ncbi:Rz1-like lysis system protein LysC [Escherichia coli]|uniref:Rz1-like lysis system protein LysC n=1 Tax=Escherichia coli TaxID=562 RepID=UPI003D9C7CD4